MRKEKFFFVIVLTVVSLFVLISLVGVRAADTGTVTATVTAQNIALTVSDGTITYGTMGIGSSAATIASGLNDSQDAVNTGNVTSKFNIKGQNSTNWTLGANPGSETYSHKFCTSSCDASPSWTALTTSYATLVASIGVGATQNFDLIVYTPSSTANYTQQSVDVTVQVTTP
ncbi:MAG TPA: hypothetical protein VMW04_03695 [Patescibacteria group bacterium]|nr:hypothetical protein [Patescibacteria group bacterium]